MNPAPFTHRPFDFKGWIERHRHLLKPPVGNKLVFEEAGMVVQVVGGPNQRVDFHDDPVEEFFYQLKGDMVLKIAEGGRIHFYPDIYGQDKALDNALRQRSQALQSSNPAKIGAESKD